MTIACGFPEENACVGLSRCPIGTFVSVATAHDRPRPPQRFSCPLRRFRVAASRHGGSASSFVRVLGRAPRRPLGVVTAPAGVPAAPLQGRRCRGDLAPHSRPYAACFTRRCMFLRFRSAPAPHGGRPAMQGIAPLAFVFSGCRLGGSAKGAGGGPAILRIALLALSGCSPLRTRWVPCQGLHCLTERAGIRATRSRPYFGFALTRSASAR